MIVYTSSSQTFFRLSPLCLLVHALSTLLNRLKKNVFNSVVLMPSSPLPVSFPSPSPTPLNLPNTPKGKGAVLPILLTTGLYLSPTFIWLSETSFLYRIKNEMEGDHFGNNRGRKYSIMLCEKSRTLTLFA